MSWRSITLLLGSGVTLLLFVPAAAGSVLKLHTAQAFQHYVELTHGRNSN